MLIKKILLILALLPYALLAQHNNMIIIDGQSNAKGIFPLANSAYKYRFAYKCEVYDSTSDNFRYACGYLSGKTYGFSSQPGRALSINPLTSLSLMIDSFSTQKYYVVMHGIGGSQLAQADSCSDWNVNSTGELYDNYVAQISKALNKLTAKGISIDTIFRIKYQGENDAITYSRSSLYEQNENDIIDSLEAEFSGYHFEHILIEIIDTYTYSSLVNGALADIANERDNVILIQNTNFVYDGVHITNDSQIALGKTLWNLIK